jgi:hypothetical protein
MKIHEIARLSFNGITPTEIQDYTLDTMFTLDDGRSLSPRSFEQYSRKYVDMDDFCPAEYECEKQARWAAELELIEAAESLCESEA